MTTSISEWVYSTSCPPYSDDVTVFDGRDHYCAAAEACCECGCMIARFEADADTDGEGGMRDCTTYECAECGYDIEARWSDRITLSELMGVIVDSMFRDPLTVMCECCTAEVEKVDAPALENCAAWAKIAKQHDERCPYVVTRNFQGHLEEDERNWFLIANDPDSQFILKV